LTKTDRSVYNLTMRSEHTPDESEKTTFIGAARRAQIIACTIDTLAEIGYAQTSIAQIAQRTGISKSAIFYHFKDKDALMWAVIVEVYTHIGQFMIFKIQAQSNVRDMLRAYISANLLYVRAYPNHSRALAEVIQNKVGKLSEEEPSEDVTLAPLQDLLESGQKSGEFRAFDTLPMAVTLRRAIDGALDQWVHNPNIDFEAYANEMLTIFDLATRKTPPPDPLPARNEGEKQE
jgi:AcrR family transcriptional regulator